MAQCTEWRAMEQEQQRIAARLRALGLQGDSFAKLAEQAAERLEAFNAAHAAGRLRIHGT